MKSSLLSLLTILIFINGCTVPDRTQFYPSKFADNTEERHVWNALLLAPDNYPDTMSKDPKRFYPFIFSYQQRNPGFVNIKQFAATLPHHPLSSLKAWYSAHFYNYNYTLSYMVMEFPDIQQAQQYLPRLRIPGETLSLRLLRYKNYLISLQIRDIRNRLVSKETVPDLYNWIENKISLIKREL